MSEHSEPGHSVDKGEPTKQRTEPPVIYEGGEDSPLFGSKDLTTSTTSKELTQAERLEGFRLSRGMELVMLCIVLIFLLAILGVFPWGQDSEVLVKGLETLKLITTSVIGFVFGSHAFERKKDDSQDG